jgi:peptidyl-prolyl cis-trans isomerase C
MSAASPSVSAEAPRVLAKLSPSARRLTLIKRVIREPLVQFLLIGFAIFVVYGVMNRGKSTNINYQIAITLDDLKQLDASFVSQWNRQPTSQEFNGLLESFVRQEILYREGLAMGLDKDDTIVKRRMAQKMEFLSEDVASAHEPTNQELQEWFAKHSQEFALPGRATFRHLFFGFDRRGQKAQSDADSTLAKISGLPEDSSNAKSQADPFMFQDYYADRTPEQLAKEFGPDFAAAIVKLKIGSWQGPIASAYGWHLIWIESITPGRIPTFQEIEPDVKTAWLTDQKAEQWAATYAKLRARYEVVALQPNPEAQAGKADPSPQRPHDNFNDL